MMSEQRKVLQFKDIGDEILLEAEIEKGKEVELCLYRFNVLKAMLQLERHELEGLIDALIHVSTENEKEQKRETE